MNVKMLINKIIGTFFMPDLLRGLGVTFGYFFKRKKGRAYPFERFPLSQRFRGEPALRLHPNGAPRCVGCKLCEVVCPSGAITLSVEETPQGGRRVGHYEFDRAKCIDCGLCAEACPVEALVQVPFFGPPQSSPQELIYDYARLTKNGVDWEPILQKRCEEEAHGASP